MADTGLVHGDVHQAGVLGAFYDFKCLVLRYFAAGASFNRIVGPAVDLQTGFCIFAW
jgi:hypothetical protein